MLRQNKLGIFLVLLVIGDVRGDFSHLWCFFSPIFLNVVDETHNKQQINQ